MRVEPLGRSSLRSKGSSNSDSQDKVKLFKNCLKVCSCSFFQILSHFYTDLYQDMIKNEIEWNLEKLVFSTYSQFYQDFMTKLYPFFFSKNSSYYPNFIGKNWDEITLKLRKNMDERTWTGFKENGGVHFCLCWSQWCGPALHNLRCCNISSKDYFLNYCYLWICIKEDIQGKIKS